MYAKLFASLYQGTLRGKSHEILVFTNLLAHCDSTGLVDKHFRAIAEETGLTVDEVKAAILVLESPDEESRSPDADGARIMRVDDHRAWGWQVVNYLKYRAIRSEEDRREQNRMAQERFRNKNKPASSKGKRDKPIPSASASSYEGEEMQEEGEQDLPPGFPTTAEKSMAMIANSTMTDIPPPEYVRGVWKQLVGVGGVDGTGRQVTRWVHYIDARWPKEKGKWEAEHPKNGNAPSSKPPPKILSAPPNWKAIFEERQGRPFKSVYNPAEGDKSESDWRDLWKRDSQLCREIILAANSSPA